ncbi:MAG: hypothetical protein CNLJKLNK_00476 [Holosporales bacterium]
MISENLKFFRKKLGLTQKELAEQLNISMSQLQKYETGKSPLSTERMKQFLKIFNIDPADLFIPQLAAPNENHYNEKDEDFQKLTEAFYKIKTGPLRKKAVAAVSLIANDPNNR